MLPKVKAIVQVYNPKFVPGPDNTEPYRIMAEREVEVLTLNLNSKGMRVRFTDTTFNGEDIKVIIDIGIEWFNAKYKIVEKV